MSFEYGKKYRTEFGYAILHSTGNGVWHFAHFTPEGLLNGYLNHHLEGRAQADQDLYRKFDIVGPLNERPTITIDYNDDTGWVLREGDRKADKMDPIELMGLIGSLVFKSPLPCLQWLMTDEQRALKDEFNKAASARRAEENAAEQKHRDAEQAAMNELRAMASAPEGLPFESIVTWVKVKLSAFAEEAAAYRMVARTATTLGIAGTPDAVARRVSDLITTDQVRNKEIVLRACEDLLSCAAQHGKFGTFTEVVEWVKERLAQDHFPAFMALQSEIHATCDRAGIQRNKSSSNGMHTVPMMPSERLAILELNATKLVKMLTAIASVR